jgi:phosphate transport system protein
MQTHTLASSVADLEILQRLVVEMTARAEAALGDATDALFGGNSQLAQQVIADDRAIDDLQRRAEQKALSTIAAHEAVSVDLRELVSTIRMANDLERIGDLSKNVAKRVIAIHEQSGSLQAASSLMPLAFRVREQLRAVGAAYRHRDDAAALEVWRSDGAVDALYTSLFRELLTYMMEDPRRIGFCAHLLFCAKNLERVGDHATNIAEIVHYMVTGDMLPERPKADASSGIGPNPEFNTF